MRKCFLVAFGLFFSVLNAQTGGDSTYEFLNLVSSARIEALGGKSIAVLDDDPNLAFYNPSLYNPQMHDQLAFNYVNYFADIGHGSAMMVKDYEGIGTFGAGVQFVNYGSFDAYNETGQAEGTFNASEFALNVGLGRKLNERFRIGGNTKFVYSSLADLTSIGMLFDFGATFYNPDKKLTASLTLRNVGFQITPYEEGNSASMPLEIQVAISKRLEHMPLRWHIILQNLETLGLSYEDPNSVKVDELTGETVEEEPFFGDKILRHVVLGGEFLLSKSFHVRFGYNYRRRQELGLYDLRKGSGFSWGFSFKISKFHMSYGRSTYHVAGANNVFSITTNLNKFGKKSKKL